MLKSDHFEHLIFPSGRTVRACKADAKKLRASAKINGEQLSHARALDFVSAQNGLEMSWHQAIELLKKQSRSSVHVEPKTLYSPCRSVSSTVITDVQMSSSDESIAGYIEGMPSLELPPHFEKLLKQPFDLQGTDFEVQYGIRNEQGHLYRVIRITSPSQHVLMMKKLEELGFYNVSTINHKQREKGCNLVFAIDGFLSLPEKLATSDTQVLTKKLMKELVDWFFYLDSDPAIESNEDFFALREHRPNWSFDMCAVYWKFAVKLTNRPFTDQPSSEIESIVRHVTRCAYTKFQSEYDRLY